jgi:PPP family 3-phenylpropionic acid transporter
MSPRVSFSLFWFFYFAGLGVHFPYFSLYLHENAGLSGTQAGIVFSTWPLVGILAQPLWGQLADLTGHRSRILALLTVAAAAGFYAAGLVHGFVPLVLVTAALAVFGTSVLPVSFSISFAAFRDDGPHAFGLARVWGTVSFLILVVGFPRILHHYQAAAGLRAVEGGPSEPGLEIMFPLTAGFVLLAGIVGFFLPREGAVAWRAQRGEWRHLMHHPPMLRLSVFTLLAYLFVQGPMALFPLYVRSLGGSIDTVGNLWILMLLLEVPLVLLTGAGVSRIGARGLLGIALLAGGVRWLTCGLTTDPRLVYPVQILHGVVVAGLMLGAPLYLDVIVPERLRSTGQTIHTMLSVGIGGIASTTGAGWLIDHFGASAPYLVGGLGALTLGALAWTILPPPTRLRLPGEGDR